MRACGVHARVEAWKKSLPFCVNCACNVIARAHEPQRRMGATPSLPEAAAREVVAIDVKNRQDDQARAKREHDELMKRVAPCVEAITDHVMRHAREGKQAATIYDASKDVMNDARGAKWDTDALATACTQRVFSRRELETALRASGVGDRNLRFPSPLSDDRVMVLWDSEVWHGRHNSDAWHGRH